MEELFHINAQILFAASKVQNGTMIDAAPIKERAL